MSSDCFLIIEDQKSIASLLKSELEKLTSQPIYLADSMAKAKHIIDSGKQITVCLSDLHLADSANGEIIRYLKGQHITTVVLTGSFKEETRKEMFRLKVADYVIKDTLASIRYAVDITHQLYKNAQRDVWVLSSTGHNSSMILGMLRNHRFNVSFYEHSSELLAELENTTPSLIVLDSVQTQVTNNSFELTKSVRDRFSQNHLPIIVCEDTNNITEAIKLMKYGVNDFYNINFTPEEFYARVKQNIEQVESYQAIERLSQTDALTGLYNRGYFFDAGNGLLEKIQKEEGYFFTLMADIDHFKAVNDTHGHQKGDEAIVFTAHSLQTIFADYLVARFGGEEFCVFGAIEDTSEVEALCEKLRHTIETESETQTGVKFTISQGMTFSGNDLDDAVSKADKALYQSKETGRNKVTTQF